MHKKERKKLLPKSSINNLNLDQLSINQNMNIPVSFFLLVLLDVSRLNEASTTSMSGLRGKRKDGFATKTTPDISTKAVIK